MGWPIHSAIFSARVSSLSTRFIPPQSWPNVSTGTADCHSTLARLRQLKSYVAEGSELGTRTLIVYLGESEMPQYWAICL